MLEETKNTEEPKVETKAPDGPPSGPLSRDVDFIDTMAIGEKAEAKVAEPEKTDKAEGTEKKEEEPAKEADKKKETAPPEEGKEKPKETKESTTVPYDRFKQVVDERNADRKELAKTREEIAELRGQVKTLVEGKAEKTAPRANVLDKTNAEIREMFLDEGGNVKGFLADLARQVRGEVMEELEGKYVSEGKVKEIAKGTFDEGRTAESEEAVNAKIEAGYKAFAEANPEFDAMWASGELEKYCDQHKHHTPISAFMVLQKEKDSKSLDEKIAEAVEAKKDEIEKEVREELKTKQVTRSLGAGPATPAKATEDDPRLKNSKEHGGRVALMTKRVLERRAQSG